jgi:splicing factor 3B subunit 1
MFPEGYEVVDVPTTYKPIRTPSRKLMATPTPMGQNFMMSLPGQGGIGSTSAYGISQSLEAQNLPDLKPEDVDYFKALIDVKDESKLSPEEAKEQKILKLLLKGKVFVISLYYTIFLLYYLFIIYLKEFYFLYYYYSLSYYYLSFY